MLLHSPDSQNTDENMISHLYWWERETNNLFYMLSIVHVPASGSFIHEAYFWNNKIFLFCENYFLEAEIVGAIGCRLVLENTAGTYHLDIAASQDHAVGPADTEVRNICEGKVLLGDYRVLDLEKQTVSHREKWVNRDKNGLYVAKSVQFRNDRFVVTP